MRLFLLAMVGVAWIIGSALYKLATMPERYDYNTEAEGV